MKAKQQNEEWNFYLKAAIKRYEAADKLCTVTTKTKRFYLMKSKIFKGRLENSCTWDTSVGFYKFSHPGKIDILYEISRNFQKIMDGMFEKYEMTIFFGQSMPGKLFNLWCKPRN